MPKTVLLLALVLSATAARAADDYKLTADSERQEGVARGKVTEHHWSSSQVFRDTDRDYWVYVPAQYEAEQPACVMVFQDGRAFLQDGSGDLDNQVYSATACGMPCHRLARWSVTLAATQRRLPFQSSYSDCPAAAEGGGRAMGRER